MSEPGAMLASRISPTAESSGLEPLWSAERGFETSRPAALPDEAALIIGNDVTEARRRNYELAYRAAFRLIGHASTSAIVAGSATTTTSPSGDRDVVSSVLRAVLEHRGPLGEVRTLRIEGVMFDDHRRRLCRELSRWTPERRLVLALRFLCGMDLDTIATITERSAEAVIAITSVWDPAESTGSTRPDALRHLDDPAGNRATTD